MIKTNTGFLNQSKTPLDSRQVVETLDDLLALDENIIYDGLECYVVSSDCKYKFNSNYNETDTGHWKLIGSNDGKIDITTTLTQDTVSDTSVPSSKVVYDELQKVSTGNSAYEIAKKNGFEGTEEEWLESLKGEDGTTYVPNIGTVTTVSSVEEATANVELDNENKLATFNFNIPKGVGVKKVEFTSSTLGDVAGIASATDTYTITFTDESTTTYEVYNGKDCDVQIDDVNDPSENTVWSSKKTSGKIAEVETELKGSIEEINDSLVDKADADKVVPKITITDTTTADAKTVIEKNWSTIPAETSAATIVTSNYGYNALINKQGKYGTVMLTVPVSGEPVYYGVLGGSSWTWQEIATMNKVKDGYARIIKNNDTDTNDAMFIAYKNRDLFGIRIYKDDNSEHELRFSASGISYVKDGVTVWTK